MHEHSRTVFGAIAATFGALLAVAEDRLAGLTFGGFVAGVSMLAGAVLVIYDQARNRRREQRRKDAELDMELDALRLAARAKADEQYRSSLSGQLEMLRAQLAGQADEHKADVEHSRQLNEQLKAALDLSNENYQRLRKTNHEIANQLAPVALERDDLRHQLDEANRRLAAISATGSRLEDRSERIERVVGEIAVRQSDSQHELPTDLAPPESPP
jgi:chromosome segregation ATPase